MLLDYGSKSHALPESSAFNLVLLRPSKFLTTIGQSRAQQLIQLIRPVMGTNAWQPPAQLDPGKMLAQLDNGLPQILHQAVQLQIAKLANTADKVANSPVLQVSIVNRVLGTQLNVLLELTALVQVVK